MFRRYRFVEGLTTLRGSEGKYLINYLGQVKDSLGNDIPVSVDLDGHKIVEVKGWRGQGIYRIVDLMVFQYKCLHIPEHLYGEVNGFVINGDKTDVQARNIGYRFKQGKLEVPHIPGFYYIPCYTRYAINDALTVVNVSTGAAINCYTSKPGERNIKGGYKVFGLYHDVSNQQTVGRHRILGLVFKDYPDNCDSLVVNHLDGIPGNDFPDNLEWVTRGQNNAHAYENDLKNQHMRILARNALTGEVTEYYSISECARQLGYPTDETIRFRLRAQFSKVFQDGYQFKLKSDERDWVIPDNPEQARLDAVEAYPVKAKHCGTGEITIYNSLVLASKGTGVSDATIKYRLARNDNSPLFGYQFKWATDTKPWPSFTQDEYLASLKPTAHKVYVRHVLTGEERVYPSIKQCQKALGYKAIKHWFDQGKQALTSTGWQIKATEEEPWDVIENPEEVLYRMQTDVEVKCETSGKVYIFPSVTSVTEFFKCDHRPIRKAALSRGKEVFKGHRFRLGVSTKPWPTE